MLPWSFLREAGEKARRGAWALTWHRSRSFAKMADAAPTKPGVVKMAARRSDLAIVAERVTLGCLLLGAVIFGLRGRFAPAPPEPPQRKERRHRAETNGAAPPAGPKPARSAQQARPSRFAPIALAEAEAAGSGASSRRSSADFSEPLPSGLPRGRADAAHDWRKAK